MDTTSRSQLVNWGIFIILSVIWGSSFILMKEGMKSLNAWQVASVRIFSAGLVLLPFSINQLRSIPRKDLPLIFLSGMLGTFIPAYLFCLAETKLDSGVAGILNALTPLFTILIGAIFFHSRLPLKKWAGVLVGFAGLVMLVIAGRDVKFSNLGYSGYIIVATICYGINVNMVSRYLKHLPSLMLASVAFGLLIIPSGIILLYTGYTGETGKPGFWYSTGASAVLGIFGTAVASVLFYMLMKKAGPLFASMVTYGIPFVALFWGFLAGETITAVQIACLGLILAGVYLANKPGVNR
jgi:drug/metabolite transporter (DMT)-like permease